MLGFLFICILCLFLIGAPIFVALGMGTTLSIMLEGNFPLVLVPQRMFAGLDSWPIMAIPMFMLAGNLMDQGGMSKRIVDFASASIGFVKGSLAMVAVLASMIFAAISGSATAGTAAIGSIMTPAFKEKGYNMSFVTVLLSAAGSIGPIIPPSINFVVWAFLSQTSTLAMFQAGMGPGVLMGVAMMIWIPIAVKTQHIACPRAPKASWGERFHSLYTSLPALGGPAILVLGIMTGIFTPTECSVVAAMYCVILAICLKRFSFKMLTKALKDTLASAGMSMCLCATGLVFNWVIVTSGLIGFMTTLLMSLGNKIIILLILNAMLLFLGCFIGSMQILIMVAPLLMNLATALGMSYVQMGVMAVLNVTLGLITPPMAPALFVTAKATGNKFETALKYTVQFLIPMFITLMITTFWEPLTMFLPRLLGSM